MQTPVLTAEQLDAVLARAEPLHDASAIEHALERMAAAIEERLAGSNPVVLGVMTGAIVPLGRLLPQLGFALEVDYIHATRYHGSTVGRDLVWLARPQTPLRGRTVLVVDDILDEGHTLAGIVQECRDEGAEAVFTAVLVDKPNVRRVPGLAADFSGLEVPDRYVFGAGMDYRGYLRNVDGIYAAHRDDEG
ncbi:hypoxanthine-guanine phosphoribosyltransferase [Sediminicurvatus halobius]|uniref:Hypoxanthine-guanine phosphoribosyltransferase n=1 Tax=Sediminicurvatus halobius TaxID=2182432 RepID=A0A2U2N2B6_9GAMM|nr:hypoxanthine-guanine phosphoribosyltransferase [Spiribacter halobius]PWG63213.1 hypoxanthine-guanine phosphoribosyltransferase [Spiribacter halobius]UEX76717.1 hypoxanthine-guanine phosphoribosyltransferase [Spiribacter halobius]